MRRFFQHLVSDRWSAGMVPREIRVTGVSTAFMKHPHSTTVRKTK